MVEKFFYVIVGIIFNAGAVSGACPHSGYIISVRKTNDGPRFIRNIKTICGYQSSGPETSMPSDYQLRIHRKNVDEIIDLPEFSAPQVPPPIGPWRLELEPINLNKITFVLPAKPEDKALEILNDKDEILDKISLSRNSQYDQPHTLNLPLNPLDNMVNTVNFVLVSQGFEVTDKAVFENHFRSMTQNLLTYEPFRSRSSQISFQSLFQTTDLECKYQGRVLICNNEKALAAVAAAGIRFSRVIVIVNNPEYGGSGGDVAAVSTNEYSDQVFVHELAHSFAGLVDEYTLFNQKGMADWKTHSNCFAGNPPAWQWDGFAIDYTLGCNYPNWYRSSKTSIMYDVEVHEFNPISQSIISSKIDQTLNR